MKKKKLTEYNREKFMKDTNITTRHFFRCLDRGIITVTDKVFTRWNIIGHVRRTHRRLARFGRYISLDEIKKINRI